MDVKACTVTARTPGPSPWWSEADVESTRTDLMASHWRRLILCEWAEGDDSLTTPNDMEAAIRGGSTVLEPRPGVTIMRRGDQAAGPSCRTRTCCSRPELPARRGVAGRAATAPGTTKPEPCATGLRLG